MPRVNIDELSFGMVISENIYDLKTKSLLLKSDTKLTDKLIESLRIHNIIEVKIAERYTLSIEPIDIIRHELKTILIGEINRIVPAKAEANPSDKITDIAQKCIRIVDNIIDDDIVINFCVQMKISDNEYLYKHCANTCALSLLIAGSLELSYSQIKDIGIAALLHDLGLCEMPTLIQLTQRKNQEEALWQEHSRYGYYFAKEKGINSDISKIILHHHEKWDGSGFPDKLSGENIPIGSRIVAICDAYDEQVRLYNAPHYLAIEQLYGGGNFFYDINVVNAFINNLAVYPLGSLVRLSTGEVGVVVNVRKNLGPRPIVKIFFNRVNRPLIDPKELDLEKERTTFIKEIIA